MPCRGHLQRGWKRKLAGEGRVAFKPTYGALQACRGSFLAAFWMSIQP